MIIMYTRTRPCLTVGFLLDICLFIYLNRVDISMMVMGDASDVIEHDRRTQELAV